MAERLSSVEASATESDGNLQLPGQTVLRRNRPQGGAGHGGVRILRKTVTRPWIVPRASCARALEDIRPDTTKDAKNGPNSHGLLP
jgi:hypothetical protein